ncbi:MAG: aspartyl protease family protein [Gemmatimonadota bacterium]
MRRHRLLLLLIGSFAACGTMDQSADRISSEARAVSGSTALLTEFVDGLVLVDVVVDGVPGWWILDSGYDYSLIDSTVAASAGMPLSDRETVPQPGGEVSQEWTRNATLELANGSWNADSLAVLDMRGLAPMVGVPLAGLLGHDFFVDHVVTIDYARQVVTVTPPDTYTGPADATSVPVWIEDGEPFVLGMLWAAGRTVPAKLKIDTGSFSGLGLNGSFVAQNRLIPDDVPRVSMSGEAVGGDVRFFVARIDSMRFGGRVIPEPIVGWTEDLTRIGDAGTVGSVILERFRVTFDYARNRLLLEPEPGSEDPEIGDSSGMLLVRPPGGDLLVAQVAPGLPADEAGLVPGDAIRSIGAQAADDLSLGEARRHFKQPGLTDTLTVVRDDGEHRLVLTQRQVP